MTKVVHGSVIFVSPPDKMKERCGRREEKERKKGGKTKRVAAVHGLREEF